MSLKNWILHKMHGLTERTDLPRSPVLRTAAVDAPPAIREARRHAPAVDGAPPAAVHLGPYAPLVGAIREELEHFVVSQLRLHLAIAERDRYRLTSIEVRATAADDSAELLRRFIVEFKPEQIKHYVAKELIGGLPNASAIDLSQFAGLNPGNGDEDAEDDEGYDELLAELRSAKPTPAIRALRGEPRRPLDGALAGHRCERRRASAGVAGAARRAQRRDRRSRTLTAAGRSRCTRFGPATATRLARAKDATSWSMGFTRAVAIARSGLIAAHGGSPISGRPTAFASRGRQACSDAAARVRTPRARRRWSRSGPERASCSPRRRAAAPRNIRV